MSAARRPIASSSSTATTNAPIRAELAERAEAQALKFGARLSAPCEIVALDIDEHLRAVLADGTDIPTRALIIASGARYRSLPLERWDEFAGGGIFYAATELEARPCANGPVTVVGGGTVLPSATYAMAR